MFGNLVVAQDGTVTWLGVLSRCHTLSGARNLSKKVEEVKKKNGLFHWQEGMVACYTLKKKL